ncbi:DALR anticodon-binding domain-containing protein [Actinomadura kijaniata]|uniref:DALR anticodon-binding domain-containing protein n=1 Tax=Actinomadura kijaniata TaxID=46161 RepID=UPI0012F952A6|nr:DALR anticodon-binding domain-containing protein [Actinomadura kijaniata]
MTPVDVGDALVAAVRDAVAGGVVPPDGVDVVGRGPGVYASPVALRLGLDPEELARRVARWPGVLRAEVARGMVVVFVEPGSLAAEVIAAGDSYGVARVPGGGWDEWPRTWENPGFAVRYAYARAAAVRRWAEELGIGPGEPVGLVRDEELALLGALGELPGRARQAERERDPGALVKCLERLAGAYHDVHERCPALPRGDEKPGAVHGARVTLAEAARIALANGMNMIGETPRERI